MRRAMIFPYRHFTRSRVGDCFPSNAMYSLYELECRNMWNSEEAKKMKLNNLIGGN
ncbi:hypothetical protein BVRB_4g082040 [Beta vulgaris subsp. vulgaris]|nr:hypothetical protein BVRB_4g082040 [Beta vulgaris subsp. vulgaris]